MRSAPAFCSGVRSTFVERGHLEQGLPLDAVGREEPEVLVLAVHEDEAAVEVAEVDVGGHVVDQGPEPRLLGSLTLDDAPELRADAQEQLEELRVDGERLVREELQHTHHRAAGHHRNREARAQAELEPLGRSAAADALERNHVRRGAPAARIERDDRQRRRLGRIADQIVAGGEDRQSLLERDTRQASAGRDRLVLGGCAKRDVPLVAEAPDPRRDQDVGVFAADEERVSDRPAGEAGHLVERDRQSVLDRGRLVRRRRGAAEQLQRLRATLERGQHTVVLQRDLADFGVRLDADGPREVAGPMMLVHVREQIGELGRGAVLGDVEAGELARRIDAEREASIDQREDDVADAERPDETRCDADELDADLLEPTGAVRERVLVAEQTDGERPPHTGSEVDRHRVDRVVDSEPFERDGDPYHDDGCHDPDDRGLPRAHEVCRRRDADEPCERGVHDRDDVRTTVAEPGQRHAGESPERRRDGRVQDHFGHVWCQPVQAAAVESVPADPEDEDADGRDREIVAADGDGSGAEASDPGAEHDDRGESDPATHGVDDRGPGEVDEPELLEPAVRALSTNERPAAPRPVAKDRVRHGRDERGQDEVAAEAHPLCDRSRHERRRGGDEPELEEEERGQERAVALEDE